MPSPTRPVACPRCKLVTDAVPGVKYNCPGCQLPIEVRVQSAPPAPPKPAATQPAGRPAAFSPPKAPPRPPIPAPAEILSLDDDPPPAPPRNRKPLLVGLAVAVLVAGGATAAFFATRPKAETTAQKPDEPAPAKDTKEAPKPPPSADADEDETPTSAPPARSMRPEEVFDRLARATVLVVANDRDIKPGWLLQSDRDLVITSEAVVAGLQKARVVAPAFNEKGEYIRESNYYLSRLANDRDALVFDAEVVFTHRETELALLHLKPRIGQQLPGGTQRLPLAAGSAKDGEVVFCHVRATQDEGVVLKPLSGKSQGLTRNRTTLEIDQPIPDKNGGAPVVNDRGEVVAAVCGTSTKSSSHGTDIERVKRFLKDAFERPGWKWSDAAAAPFEPKDRLALYLSRLAAATDPEHLLKPDAAPPDPLPALAPAAKERQLLYLRRIARIGDPARDAIPKLARYLYSPDREVRQMTLEVLRGLQAVVNLDMPVILAGLRSWSMEANIYAAWAYSKVPAPAEATERLGELLRQNDPKREKAELRVLVLKAIANNTVNTRQELARRVLDCLDDRVGDVRNEAGNTLGKLMKGLPSWLVDDFRELLRNGPMWRNDPTWKTPDYIDPASAANGNGRLTAALVLVERLDINQIPYPTFREMFYPLLSERPVKGDQKIKDEKLCQEMRLAGVTGLEKWGLAAQDCLHPVPAKIEANVRHASRLGLVDLTSDQIQRVRVAAVKAIKAIGVRKGSRLLAGGEEGYEDQKRDVDLIVLLDGLADSDSHEEVRKEARDARMALLEKWPDQSDVPLLRKLLRPSTDPAIKAESEGDRARAARLLRILVTNFEKDTSVKALVASATPELIAGVHQKDAESGPDEGLQYECLLTLEKIADTISGQTPEAGRDLARAVADILTPVGKVGGTSAPPPGGADLASRLLRSSVWVSVDNGKRHGTGVVVEDGPNPLVLTNYHVIAGARQATVIFVEYTPQGRDIGDAKHYESNLASLRAARKAQSAALVDSDPELDLALLRLPVRLPDGAAAIPLASASARTGDALYLRGMSGVHDGSLWRYSSGEVRQFVPNATFRYRSGQVVRSAVIEHSLQTNPGDSGGGIVNAKGELVAVNCSRDGGSLSVAQAIDRSEIVKFLDRQKRGRSGGTLDSGLGGGGAGGPAAGESVQTAGIRVLKALGPATIAQLGESLSKAGGPAQAVRICNALREFAEQKDPKQHPELANICLGIVIPFASDPKHPVASNPDVVAATSLLAATVGGTEVILKLKELADSNKYPAPVRRWAVRALGQLDPKSPWLEPDTLRPVILGSPKLKQNLGVEGIELSDTKAKECRDRIIKFVEASLNARATDKFDEELRTLGREGLARFQGKMRAK